MVPSLTPYDLSFPQNGGSICPPTYANGHISATGDPIHFMFGSMVAGTADLMALFSIRQIQDGGRRHLKYFEWPYLRNGYLYSAHRAVIFAIAQLSCSYILFLS